MSRINIYEEDENGDETFIGWFDKESAHTIASYTDGNFHKDGKILFATAKGKLVVNSWNNRGYDKYRFADDELEITEILSAGGYAGDDKKLTSILEKYEI